MLPTCNTLHGHCYQFPLRTHPQLILFMILLMSAVTFMNHLWGNYFGSANIYFMKPHFFNVNAVYLIADSK